jgi:hypothetical protein
MCIHCKQNILQKLTTVKHSQQLFEHTYTSDPSRSRNTHSYRILPTGPLVATFQHSLQFLQSESFQTHVGTIHRRAVGPLALHNGISAYTSLTRHLPALTIECLHRPPYKLTCSSHNFDTNLASQPQRSPQPNTHVRTRPISRPDCSIRRSSKTIVTSVHCRVHNYSAHLHCYLPSIVA